MSIKSKLSIALALVALGFGSTAFAEEINVSGLVTSTTGTGYSRIPLGYDAQGKLHVINLARSGSAGSPHIADRTHLRPAPRPSPPTVAITSSPATKTDILPITTSTQVKAANGSALRCRSRCFIDLALGAIGW
jgi:hypothetical protein